MSTNRHRDRRLGAVPDWFEMAGRADLPRTKCGPNANLVPVGSPPKVEIICYYKGLLQRARGDSNTQPPDP
jgi:hypothetical protein